MIESRKKLHEKPIYFPLCKTEGKIGANQTYFEKLPQEILSILHISDGAIAKLKCHEDAIITYLSARKFFKNARSLEHVNWCDDYLAMEYFNLGNGPDAKFHAQLHLNYSKVVENLGMEAYARYRLRGSVPNLPRIL